MSTDKEWEKWGQRDPYYGVLTDPKFRSASLNTDAKNEFFASGDQHIKHVLDIIHDFVDPTFSPRQGLDFGCGTGRVTLAMAKVMGQVDGIDISDSMLQEAGKNCRELQRDNVKLHKSDDQLTSLQAQRFDFIHTCIVLQHIPIDRVRIIFSQLLHRLKEGGVGAIHLTYAQAGLTESHGMIPDTLGTRANRFYRRLRRIMRGIVYPGKDPEMQMNSHVLNHLFYSMQSAGVRRFHSEFTNDGGYLGVFLYFKKEEPVAKFPG